MIKKYILLIIVALTLINCRTMSINQTAETLKPKELETTFSCDLGASFSEIGGFNFGMKLDQRIGLKENLEMQIRLESSVSSLIYYYPQIPNISNFLDVGIKAQVLNKSGHHLALLPFMGIYGGWSGSFNGSKYGMLGPDVGLKIIGSYDIDKKFGKEETNSIYYGLSMETKYNFLALNRTYEAIRSNYITPVAMPDFDLGVSLGWESKFKSKNNNYIVLRHEVCFSSSFLWSVYYNPYNGGFIGTNFENYIISLDYSVSIGGGYRVK